MPTWMPTITPTRLLYVVCAAAGGFGAAGYLIWAVIARFSFIAALNDRAQLETNVLVVLCAAIGLLAFPLGAAAGLLCAVAVNRLADYARRARRSSGDSRGHSSWVTRRGPRDG